MVYIYIYVYLYVYVYILMVSCHLKVSRARVVNCSTLGASYGQQLRAIPVGYFVLPRGAPIMAGASLSLKTDVNFQYIMRYL